MLVQKYVNEMAWLPCWLPRNQQVLHQRESEEFIAGSLEAAYSLNWGAREIWGKGGGETLALL